MIIFSETSSEDKILKAIETLRLSVDSQIIKVDGKLNELNTRLLAVEGEGTMNNKAKDQEQEIARSTKAKTANDTVAEKDDNNGESESSGLFLGVVLLIGALIAA